MFESAIDLLSYGTLELLSSRDWRQENCLSLAGIYRPKKNIEESTPPAALIQYLKDYPQITEIALHLDNDAAGRLAAKTIKALLPSTYTVSDEPPQRGKEVSVKKIPPTKRYHTYEIIFSKQTYWGGFFNDQRNQSRNASKMGSPNS